MVVDLGVHCICIMAPYLVKTYCNLSSAQSILYSSTSWQRILEHLKVQANIILLCDSCSDCPYVMD